MKIDPDLLKLATPDELAELTQLLESQALLSSPASFAQSVSGGEYKVPPHVAMLDRHLVDVAEGRIRKLLVTMPPRHGKSELCSRYTPAWFLSCHPNKRVILTSYEAEFAASWGRKARDLIEEHPECGVRVRSDSKAAANWNLLGANGGMSTAGAGGPITGKGAHLLIIDDPHKSAEEANSPVIREKVWEWYRATALTRLEPGGAVVLVQTRWHEEDLAGRCLAEERGDWTVLNLPAIAEEEDDLGRSPGTPLWPERYDLAALEQIRKEQGSYWFSALYQGRPQPAEGGLFKREHFRYWKPTTDHRDRQAYDVGGEIVPTKDTWRFLTVDLAASVKTTADFTVMAAWAVTPNGDLLLLDRTRERLEGPDHLNRLKAMVEKWKPRYAGVERATYGLSLIQAALREGIVCRELRPDRDKVTRALVGSSMCEQGRIYFPAGAAWLGEWEGELLGFPTAAHDDQVDSLAYAAIELSQGIIRGKRGRKFEPVTAQQKWEARFDKRGKKDRLHPWLGKLG